MRQLGAHLNGAVYLYGARHLPVFIPCLPSSIMVIETPG
ncbi:hypothetical protein APY04_1801 [Hyphomicrobium sulfonivorans]|uniref:Uncharacterized protein n=1 Tax=Hyphomicrobium sulfonivorans TaxID=121290 RepID=A0A120CVX9_HYPSL|nr:hypothetical protein APY04_1801 [Hyphomicrobium sulfonivorans]